MKKMNDVIEGNERNELGTLKSVEGPQTINQLAIVMHEVNREANIKTKNVEDVESEVEDITCLGLNQCNVED